MIGEKHQIWDHTQGRHAGKKKLHKMEIKPDQERHRDAK